jgi:hypothetical protein
MLVTRDDGRTPPKFDKAISDCVPVNEVQLNVGRLDTWVFQLTCPPKSPNETEDCNIVDDHVGKAAGRGTFITFEKSSDPPKLASEIFS